MTLLSIKKAIAGLVSRISPKLFFSIAYWHNRGRWPNLKTPSDISEIMIKQVLDGEIDKLSWLADKYAVREYVKSKGLETILPKLIGVYTSVDEIDFDKLPDKFALKMNYGSGMNIICTGKDKFDSGSAKQMLESWLNCPKNYSYSESHYNLIPRKIVCEEFIDDGTGGYPYDYKFMCVKGEPACVVVCSDRGSGNLYYASYNMSWNPLPHYDRVERRREMRRPENFQEMINVARKLSESIDFVRIDLYSDGKKIWFGEVTLTHSGCIFHEYTMQAIEDLGMIYRNCNV